MTSIGLSIKGAIDENTYAKGIKVSDEELVTFSIERGMLFIGNGIIDYFLEMFKLLALSVIETKTIIKPQKIIWRFSLNKGGFIYARGEN